MGDNLPNDMKKVREKGEAELAPNWFGYNPLTQRGVVPVDPPAPPPTKKTEEPRYIVDYKDQPLQGQVLPIEMTDTIGTDRAQADGLQQLDAQQQAEVVRQWQEEIGKIRAMKGMYAKDKKALIEKLRPKYQGVKLDWDAAMNF